MAPRFGRSSPDPKVWLVVELHRGYLHRLFTLISEGLALTSQRITSEQRDQPSCSLSQGASPESIPVTLASVSV